MTQLVAQLQTQIDKVFRILKDPSLLALASQDGTELMDQATELSRRLSRAEGEPLTVGLLGGTGVGKSSILNALAGSKISAASHRRPRTDHVLIYRHEEASGMLPERLNNIPWQEFTHNNGSIGKILLCDLPDFDSIQTEHRERVLGFLEYLDLLIWVTSPEKYADQTFHDFLAAVPKAQQNFFFVLNKVDLLFEGRTSEKGYEEVAAMSRAFQKRLQENGMSDPVVFLISAKASGDGESTPPWNQFSSFKQQVFQERRLKEVTAIKATNLDVEVQALLRHMGQGMKNLETFETVLVETMGQLHSQRSAWLEEWERALEGWTEGYIRERMGVQRPEPIPLMGPGYGLALLMDGLGRRLHGTKECLADPSTQSFPNAVYSTFETHLLWLDARMGRQLLRHNLPGPFSDWAKSILQIPKRLERLKAALSQTLAWHMEKPTWPSFSKFKIWQRFCYVGVLAVFLVAIGGQTRWEGLLNTPCLKSLVQLILSGIHTLFSSKGLAALGSYVILNLFLGFRFYRRFLKLADRVVDKRVAALRAELNSAWQRQIDSVTESFHEVREDVQKVKTRLSATTGPVS